MQLGIYSLKKILFEGAAKSVNVKAVHGELTILDFHRPLITMLVPGRIRVTDNEGREQSFAVQSGFLEVKPGSEVNLLVDE